MENKKEETTKQGSNPVGFNYIGILDYYDFSGASETVDLDKWLELTLNVVKSYGDFMKVDKKEIKLEKIKISMKKKQYIRLLKIGGAEYLSNIFISVVGGYEKSFFYVSDVFVSTDINKG